MTAEVFKQQPSKLSEMICITKCFQFNRYKSVNGPLEKEAPGASGEVISRGDRISETEMWDSGGRRARGP